MIHSVLTTLGFICLIIVVIVLFAYFVYLSHCFVWFKWRACKHCGHTLEYKGFVGDSEGGHYLFHCPKCGKWECVLKKEFFHDLDEGFNNSNNMLW